MYTLIRTGLEVSLLLLRDKWYSRKSDPGEAHLYTAIMNLKFVLISLFLLILSPGLVLAQPPVYGPGISANELANLELGKPSTTNNRVVYIRFKAQYSDLLTSVVVYIQPGTGYSNSPSTRLALRLFQDDGTVNHRPSGLPLAVKKWSQQNTTDHSFDQIMLDTPVLLLKGQLYHLGFWNEEANPDSSWTSLNFLHRISPDLQHQPYINNDDLGAISFLRDVGQWVDNPGFTPTFTVYYANGQKQGQAYLDVYSASGMRKIYGGAQLVREAITVSDSERQVFGLGIFVRKIGLPSAALVARLENGDGTEIETVTFSPSTISANDAWHFSPFKTSHVLSVGLAYHLLLSSAGDQNNCYAVYPIKQGLYKGLAGNCFTDGIYQFSVGTQWMVQELANPSNLQFYFSLEPPPAIAPQILSPVNGQLVAPPGPVVTWTKCPSATQYQSQVSVDSSFKESIIDSVVSDTLLTIRTLWTSAKYYVRVRSWSINGPSPYSPAASFGTKSPTTSTNSTSSGDVTFTLRQNFPNPFNPTTLISFDVSTKERANLKIVNILGQVVATLFDGTIEMGHHSYTWNASNLPTGIYFCYLTYSNLVQVTKMLLIR